MSKAKGKRVTITFYEGVDSKTAVDMVKLALDNGIKKGSCFTFNNGLGVEMPNNAQCAFLVWVYDKELYKEKQK